MCSSVLWCLDLLSPPTSHPDLAPSHITDYFCLIKLLLPKLKSQFHRSSISLKSRAVPSNAHSKPEGCFPCKGQHKSAQNDLRAVLIELWIFSPLLLAEKKVGLVCSYSRSFTWEGNTHQLSMICQGQCLLLGRSLCWNTSEHNTAASD